MARASLVAQTVKHLPAVQDTGSIPGLGRSLEKETTTHSSIPVWKIPWTEEPDGLETLGSQRVRVDWVINTLTLRLTCLPFLPPASSEGQFPSFILNPVQLCSGRAILSLFSFAYLCPSALGHLTVSCNSSPGTGPSEWIAALWHPHSPSHLGLWKWVLRGQDGYEFFKEGGGDGVER